MKWIAISVLLVVAATVGFSIGIEKRSPAAGCLVSSLPSRDVLETVDACHGELAQRTADFAQLQRTLNLAAAELGLCLRRIEASPSSPVKLPAPAAIPAGAVQ